MKKVLIVAVALASVNAFATRARVTALGNSSHLIDTQTVYTNPADMMTMADYVNFESGKNNGAAATQVQYDNAEGMITRSMGDSKLGLSLGHQSQNASVWSGAGGTALGTRTVASAFAPGIIGQQNPIGLFYGMKMNDMLIGGELVYSNYNDKIGAVKETSSGFRLGVRTGPWDAKIAIGLANTWEDPTNKFTGTGGIGAGVGYWMEDTYFNLNVDSTGFKTETKATGAESAKMDYTAYTLSALKSIKHDGSELFYGVGIMSSNLKVASGGVDQVKLATLALPVTLGMEVDANTWLTLRGSVTQNVIISNSKDEGAAPTEFAPGANTTVAAVGTGLKFGKLNVDATLQGLTGGAASQKVNGTDLLALVGATYMY